MAPGDESDKPYLPARYRQKVREKQQRRLMLKILTAAIIVVVGIILLWFMYGMTGFSQQGNPLSPPQPAATTAPVVMASPVTPAPTVTAREDPPVSGGGYTIAPGVPVEASEGMLSLTGAEAALREYYPVETYSITRVNYSAGSSRSLFGFAIRPATSTAHLDESVVFIDAATGKPWAYGQESAVFPQDKVNGVVTSTFADTEAGDVRSWYDNRPDTGGIWRFILVSGNSTRVSGCIDASTGELIAFTRTVFPSGRPINPAISQEKAQNIAGKYISDHRGGSPSLNMTEARYESWGTPSVPAAGQYIFSWERLSFGYPVDTDRIMVAIDAITGDVIGYDIVWTTPDYAFSQTVEPVVSRRDASFAVMQTAAAMYPDSVESVRILSTGMRWNNKQDPGTSQRPGSVALAWKIMFDDETIRASASLPQGIAWVDTRTGNVTAIEYRHEKESER